MLVEVMVPVLNLTFDFDLQDAALAEDAAAEVAEVVCRYEQCALNGDRENLILCLEKQRRILAAGMTLAENGVRTGDRLMLL